jgi:DeoR family fructose operon transcriptional repressor
VVDSSKIGTEVTYRLCGIEECDLIVTDSGLSGTDLDRLRAMTEVQIAQ